MRNLSAFVATAAIAAALAVPAAAQTASAPAREGTLAKIRAAKQIDVAYAGDSPPFSFVGKDGPAGYSIDLCKRVIAQIGRAAGVPDLKVNWRAGTVAERLEMVKSRRADLECGNTTATLTRMQDVDFSVLVFIDGAGLLVKAGSPVRTFADLAGRTVGVIGGTTNETRLAELLKRRLVDAKVVAVRDGNAGPAMLLSGSLDAFVGDRVKLVGLAATSADPKALAILPDELSIEPYAFALPRDDSAFRLEVNRALTQVYLSGEIDAIYMQWLAPLGKPSGVLAVMFLLNAIPQ